MADDKRKPIKPMSDARKKGRRAYDKRGNVRPADERFLEEGEREDGAKAAKAKAPAPTLRDGDREDFLSEFVATRRDAPPVVVDEFLDFTEFGHPAQDGPGAVDLAPTASGSTEDGATEAPAPTTTTQED